MGSLFFFYIVRSLRTLYIRIMEHNFPENFRRLRKERGYTLEKLAREIGVSEALLCQWESGRYSPQLKRLLIIADVFCVTLDELIYGNKTV